MTQTTGSASTTTRLACDLIGQVASVSVETMAIVDERPGFLMTLLSGERLGKEQIPELVVASDSRLSGGERLPEDSSHGVRTAFSSSPVQHSARTPPSCLVANQLVCKFHCY